MLIEYRRSVCDPSFVSVKVCRPISASFALCPWRSQSSFEKISIEGKLWKIVFDWSEKRSKVAKLFFRAVGPWSVTRRFGLICRSLLQWATDGEIPPPARFYRIDYGSTGWNTRVKASAVRWSKILFCFLNFTGRDTRWYSLCAYVSLQTGTLRANKYIYPRDPF